MAEVLTLLGWLALGVFIGWAIKRQMFAHAAHAQPVDLADAPYREWRRHCEAHAGAQAGSVVWTPPEAFMRNFPESLRP